MFIRVKYLDLGRNEWEYYLLIYSLMIIDSERLSLIPDQDTYRLMSITN